MIYFDTAYIAKCYLDEPGASFVQSLAEEADGLCSCEIARTELFATVHRHYREGRITRTQLREVFALFEGEEQDGVWLWLPVTSALIQAACDTIRALRVGVFVRAADALHLQCAKEHGHVELFTNDRHVIAAARHFGLTARNVIP
ncbi:MAG: type II toxin-antitoxin system VapC family toxin [Deltaproteobacteria bacterium]|nr:type II toxin-antitoxin system VapC family toxin [Deltaproteobacteria bacterium]